MMSTCCTGSPALESRMNSRVCVTIDSISSRSRSNLARTASSSSISVRRRMRVIGVLRSCDIAARTRMRSEMKRASRCCMALNAFAARRTSTGPSSGIGGSWMLAPRRSAAAASLDSGSVTQRTAMSEIATTVATSTSSVSATLNGTAAACGTTPDSKVTSVVSLKGTWTVKYGPGAGSSLPPCGGDRRAFPAVPSGARTRERPRCARRAPSHPRRATASASL